MRAKIFRPLIDLPKHSKARERFQEKKPEWTPLHGDKSIEVMVIQNDELAKIQINEMMPEILSNTADADGCARTSVQMFHNPSRKTRIVLVAVHHWEDDDDPEKLECGWSAAILRGPESKVKQLSEWAEYFALIAYRNPFEGKGTAQ
jgi:hypothetical protein